MTHVINVRYRRHDLCREVIFVTWNPVPVDATAWIVMICPGIERGMA